MSVESTNRLSRLVDRIPEGAIAETYVYGLLTFGALASIKTKSEKPICAVVQGLVGAGLANTITSVLIHRAGVHGSIELSSKVTSVGRVMQAAIGGLHTDRAAAAHRVHHAYADEPEDPHAPINEGRLNVFAGITGLIKDFAKNNPELVAREQHNPYTKRKAIDHWAVTTAGIIGSHLAIGHLAHLPVKYRLFSAATHISGEYILHATFTADSHAKGKAQNLGLSPLTSIIMGGENDHADHHKHPKSPRHGKYDPGYVLARGLEKIGLAKT